MSKNNNIKVSFADLKNAEGSIIKIINSAMDVKSAYWLSKLSKKFVLESKKIESTRISLVEKYGEKDEKGGTKVPDGKMEEFYKEYSRFLESTVEFEVPRIKVEILSQVKLSPNDFVNLEPFIEVSDDFIKSVNESVK